jgi:hypothetical protein
MKIAMPISIFVLFGLFSCTRKFECACDYKQTSTIINEQGVAQEIVTDEQYTSSIMYTSKKIANEECEERGRSLAIDSTRSEISCKVVKDR